MDKMNNQECMKSFISAAGLLPERLWRGVFSLSEAQRIACEEIRVRLYRPLEALVNGKSVELKQDGNTIIVNSDELDELIARATDSSVHTFNQQIKNGFITSQAGHRLGICGQAVMEHGDITTIREISSVNLRIAKQLKGIGDEAYKAAYEEGFESTLILSPPGGGKTTLLRDICRLLSTKYNVSIADERMEIAACNGGKPRFDIGSCDVMSGGAKAFAMETLLRAMSPQIIALDEISAANDIEAMLEAAHTGCKFITTAHANSIAELKARTAYRRLLAENIFSVIVVIHNENGQRKYRMFKSGGDENVKAFGSCDDNRVMLGNRNFYEC